METEARYTVFVGGVEVNDYLLTKEKAERVAEMWKDDGYDDVSIEIYTDEELSNR